MGFEIGQPLLWPYPPNWSDSVSESLAWLTDIMQASNGAQQARALREAPRRTFAFKAMAHGDARRIVDAVRFYLGVRSLLLPVYPDVQLLGASLAAGAASIPCRTAGFDFADGGKAVLWADANAWELVDVDTVGANSLTLATGTANAWGAGTQLYPVRRARLKETPRAAQYNDDLVALQLQFLIDEPCDWAAAWPSAATYRGMPVLEWRGDESQDPTDSFDRTTSTVDQDVGPVFYIDLPGMAFRMQSQAFQIIGRDSHTAFRSLLYALAGRAGQIWVPSWMHDVQLRQPAAGTDTQLQVNWCGYTQFGFEQVNRRDLRFELLDGTVIYRRVIGSAETADGETLQLDASLGQAIAPAAIRQISWMSLCTLASDTVEIIHDTDADGVARAGVNWQAVKNDV